MTFPYKIYQSRNISVPAYIYLGKAAIAGYYGSQTSFFPHQVLKDCEDVFLYGTLIGSTNLKITAASAEDPYIYLDTRWTNFSVSADTSSSYSFIQSVTTDTNFTLNANFRSLSSDGSLLIKSGANSTFFWNGLTTVPDPDIQVPANCQTDNATVEDGQIIIKRYDYSFVDAPITDSFWAQKAVSLIDDKVVDQATYTILMQLKALVGSECIKVEDTERGTIKISFDKENCPCGCFNVESSESSQSSVVDICFGISSECLHNESNESNLMIDEPQYIPSLPETGCVLFEKITYDDNNCETPIKFELFCSIVDTPTGCFPIPDTNSGSYSVIIYSPEMPCACGVPA